MEDDIPDVKEMMDMGGYLELFEDVIEPLNMGEYLHTFEVVMEHYLPDWKVRIPDGYCDFFVKFQQIDVILANFTMGGEQSYTISGFVTRKQWEKTVNIPFP